ncbi:hypothetical protein [Streptomyces diastatochromogenes]|uniref:Uncharacterized protein n=1 Tax=Streptomyces diastatochromogenes TaxID=42236 RepID=A0A233SPE0_STRDA|nr:hypothetical protein [Streptomyces diastatochromogenes]OXY97537.1 hypothetical protein BEK98_08230 [Streptomyces diastatochromogenes]
MNELVQLALPCRMLTLKMQVGPEDGETTLETLVTKAIGTGLTKVQDLADLFVLPYRVVLDVVTSLWARGLVTIDLQSGDLALSDGGRDSIGTGSGTADENGVQESRSYLFEPITGSFYAEREGTAKAPPQALRAPVDHGLKASDLPQRDLLAAVRAATRYGGGAGFRRRILNVSFGNPLLQPPQEIRWYTVGVQVRADDDSGRLTVSVADPGKRFWSARAEARFQEYFARLGDEQPDSGLVQALRGRASRVLLEPEGVPQLLTRLAAQVEKLPKVEAVHAGQHQQKLEDVGRQIQQRLRGLLQARAHVEPIENAQGHEWALKHLLAKASKQVVIVSPSIRYSTLKDLLPDLQDALKRRVRLVFSWGRTIGDSIAPEVRTALSELAARYPGRVLLSDASVRTAACVVIQDNVRAYVSAHGPLDLVSGSGGQLTGLLIEPSKYGPELPACVAELLLWVRRTGFAGQERLQVLTHQDEFPAADDVEPVGAEIAETPLPEGPTDATPEMMRIWAASWHEHRAALADAVRQATDEAPSVELVEDGAHQDYLWQALHGATDRLVLADDRISARAATERVAGALRECADRGVAVHLVQPSPGRDADAVKPFTKVVEGTRGITVHRRRSGVRLVARDDTLQLGSFAPLGRSTARVEGTGSASQLGVRVHGSRFVTDLLSRLGVEQDPYPAPRDQESAPPAPPVTDGATAAYGALVTARQADAEGGYGEALTEILRDLDDPWRVLEVWQERKVSATDLRRAAATLLRLGDRVPSAHRRRWCRWLVADAWSRHAYFEAALVGRLLPDSGERLAAAVCTAALPLEFGPVGMTLEHTALEIEDEGDRAVAAVGGLAETLLWGGPSGGQVVDLHGETLSPRWRELAAAARELGLPEGRGLPLDAFTAELATTLTAAEAEERWAVLARRIDEIRRRRGRFNFGAGQAWHDGMFAADGVLTRIEAATTDLALRPGLGSELPSDVRRHVDRLVADAGEEPIQWRKQMSHLNRIEELVLEARRLSAGAVRRADAGEPVLASFRSFAALTAQAWDGLFSEADVLQPPYRHPPLALLERLKPVANWARVHA